MEEGAQESGPDTQGFAFRALLNSKPVQDQRTRSQEELSAAIWC